MCHISHALQSLLTDFCGIITVNLYSRTDTDEKWINNNYNFGINDCRACNLWQRKFGRVLEPLAILNNVDVDLYTTGVIFKIAYSDLTPVSMKLIEKCMQLEWRRYFTVDVVCICIMFCFQIHTCYSFAKKYFANNFKIPFESMTISDMIGY